MFQFKGNNSIYKCNINTSLPSGIEAGLGGTAGCPGLLENSVLVFLLPGTESNPGGLPEAVFSQGFIGVAILKQNPALNK